MTDYWLQRPDWFDEKRFWKRFWTGAVWVLLSLIPAVWIWLYRKTIKRWFG